MISDIFKLIFEHDLRLEQLSDEFDPRQELKRSSTIEEFMKPVQTYSSFYITGTVLPEMRFGINTLKKFSSFSDAFYSALGKRNCISYDGVSKPLDVFLESCDFGQAVIIPSAEDVELSADKALFNSSLHVREKIPFMRPLLDAGHLILFTEKAHNGFDIHLFSKMNIYESFF
jgi:hypothetical protein